MGDIVNFENSVQEITDPGQRVYESKPFPTILTPTIKTGGQDVDFWTCWVQENVTVLKEKFLKRGAILFRGFPIKTPEEFDSFIQAFGYLDFPYVGGAAPRVQITSRVFTANEAPPDKAIPFHHEMAQVPTFPKVLFFYCAVPPPTGGETSIAPSPLVYNVIKERSPNFVRKLEEEGVRYVRMMREEDDPASPIGRGWKSTYLTQDKAEMVRKATVQGTELQWNENGVLKTTTKLLPATRLDTRTGKTSWFNSINDAYQGWEDDINNRIESVRFGNGDLMKPDDMDLVETVLKENGSDIKWRTGDVMMVDNRQALHARNPGTVPRRILACLQDE